MVLHGQDHQRFLPAVQTFIVVRGHKVPLRTLFAGAENVRQRRSRLESILNVAHSENKLSWQLEVGG